MAKFIHPSYQILTNIDTQDFYTSCEAAARTCYKSEKRITEGSAEKLIRNLIKNGHEAMLEHCPNIAVRFICDRAFSHEIVRMRLCSFAQESQRYVKYDEDMEFILSEWVEKTDVQEAKQIFHDVCNAAAKRYSYLVKHENVPPQDARCILPNATKTEIVVTANVREWRHVLKLRTEQCAHPEMRRLMRPLLLEFIEKLPALFDDIDTSWNV